MQAARSKITAKQGLAIWTFEITQTLDCRYSVQKRALLSKQDHTIRDLSRHFQSHLQFYQFVAFERGLPQFRTVIGTYLPSNNMRVPSLRTLAMPSCRSRLTIIILSLFLFRVTEVIKNSYHTMWFQRINYYILVINCQAAQKVQWDTTAMMTRLHHVFPIWFHSLPPAIHLSPSLRHLLLVVISPIPGLV